MKALMERLRREFQVGKIGYWELDLADRSMWWSDECYEIFQLDPASHPAAPDLIETLIHPLDRANYRRIAAKAWDQGTPADIEFRVVLPGGAIRWIHAQGRPLRGGSAASGGHRRVGIYQDITERVHRDQNLLLLLQAVFHINDAIVVFSCEGSMRRCATIFANSPLHSFVGERANGRDAAQAFFACLKAQQPELSDIEKALESGHAIRREVIASGPDDEAVWLDVDLVPLTVTNVDSDRANLWVAVSRDTTEAHRGRLKNAQLLKELRALNRELESQVARRTAELAREKAQYEALAENAPQIIWRYEIGTGLTYCNRSGMLRLGRTFEELAGQGFQDLLHPDDRQQVLDKWRQSLKSGTHFTGYRRLLDASGQYRSMSYYAAPVLPQEGGAQVWIGVDTDISDLKKIEAELVESNSHLEAFSYSVSHDLRSPLALIDGFSSLLQRDLEDREDAKSRHYLQRIRKATAQMAQLIEDMLSLAKITKAEAVPRDVDVSRIAQDVVDRLVTKEPKRRALVTVQPGLTAFADERLLRITLDNLIGNAWKFTSKNADARIEVGCLPGTATFFVRDNGVGFDDTQAKRLFGVFQRLHKESDFPGTGIGLATVHRIVTRHGGKLWTESQRGKGATFFFTLSPDSVVLA